MGVLMLMSEPDSLLPIMEPIILQDGMLVVHITLMQVLNIYTMLVTVPVFIGG